MLSLFSIYDNDDTDEDDTGMSWECVRAWT
jgi:hypothetical protein